MRVLTSGLTNTFVLSREDGTMPELRYTIVIYPDGDAYSVLVPALPGCVTFGRSPA